MSDDVLNNYINNLLTANIENDKFEQYIDIFSRFLGYVNPDYKYNGTYLGQYIDDFKQLSQALKNKNDKYNEVFMKLVGIGTSFELSIDRVYYGRFSEKHNFERKYVDINKSKIMNDSIEVRVIIEHEEDKYLFCKDYDDLENQLSTRVYKDIKAFMKMKKIRGTSNGIA